MLRFCVDLWFRHAVSEESCQKSVIALWMKGSRIIAIEKELKEHTSLGLSDEACL